eukprot:5870318-Prymnesium_polylepis.2
MCNPAEEQGGEGGAAARGVCECVVDGAASRGCGTRPHGCVALVRPFHRAAHPAVTSPPGRGRPLTAYCLLLTAYCLLLTAYYSLHATPAVGGLCWQAAGVQQPERHGARGAGQSDSDAHAVRGARLGG